MYRLIIADDEENIREGLKRCIESMDLPINVVATAENGLIALESIKKYRPELLLIDINMPKLSGLELIEKIREFDKQCEIIIVSGYDKFEYAKQALKYNVSDYLLKPLEEENLYQTLESSIEKINSKHIVAKNEDFGDSNEDIIMYVKSHYLEDTCTLDSLIQKFSRSRSSLYKIFKSQTGSSFQEYVTFLRLQRAKDLLNTSLSIKEVSIQVGFSDQHYFSRLFRQKMGMSPKEFKEKSKQL